MKEKWNQFREWMKKVKKQAVITLAALLIVCGAVAVGIMVQTKNSKAQAKEENQVAAVTEKEEEKPVTPAVDTQDEEPEKAEEEQEAEEKDAQKADKEEAEEPVAEKERAKKQPEKQEAKANKETSSKTSSKVQTTEKKTSSSSSKKQSSSSSTKKPSKPAHTHDWKAQYKKEKVWVVDKKAWTETVEEPVYSQKLVWYCNTCGEDITSDPEGHVDETMHAGYKSSYETVQTGTDTYTINHPEEGHYETESYISGYKCSCGATK